jgi:hypothetical protein
VKIIIAFLFVLLSASGMSQGLITSNNNYTGNWENAGSWTASGTPLPTPPPGYTIGAYNIDIYGYITADPASIFNNLRLGVNTSARTLTIYDTLVIYNNITSGNNPMKVVIKSGGMLIVFGDFNSRGVLDIEAGGILVVKGTLTNNGGSFPGAGTVYGTVDPPGFVPADQDSTIAPDLENQRPEIYDFLINGIPLPVEILYFTAKKMIRGVQLNWATVREENFEYFTLERASDGKQFHELGQIFSETGFSNTKREYAFYDEMPLAGYSFYRLKTTDFDGYTEYHGVVSIRMDEIREAVRIFPNPVHGNQVKINFSGAKTTLFKLVSFTGQTLQTGSLSQGINEIQFRVPLDPGIYFIQLEDPGLAPPQKLIIR